jgi:hypothetical protein
VNDLRAGMDAAVGASRANGGYGSAGDLRQRRFERVLDGAAARLRLPAEKATAVVLQSESDAQD